MQTLINKIKTNDIWQNYKGNQYRIIALSYHSENLDQYIIGKTGYNNKKNNITWICPVKMPLGILKQDNDVITFLEKNAAALPKAFTDSTDKYLSLNKDKSLINQINTNDVWQHYKGKQYRIIALACHPEELTLYVVYEALYNNPVSQIWHRPMEMFLGTLEIDGTIVPRFVHVGEK